MSIFSNDAFLQLYSDFVKYRKSRLFKRRSLPAIHARCSERVNGSEYITPEKHADVFPPTAPKQDSLALNATFKARIIMKPYTPTSTQPTLLFIPDISGFTQFVHNTEITHSQHIIEELLEVLIDANEIGLVVSEIEGDAILFYLEGKAPTAAELLAQVQRMYVKFHAHLKKYETHRICQCGACRMANQLALKFVVHYGDIAHKQVKQYSKLFGKDVIVAHRLMKNEVPHEEYVLLTHQLINACSSWVQIEQAAWAAPESGEGTYDFGSISYCSIPLDPLKNHVPEPTIEDYSLPGATTKLVAFETVIEAPIELVFDVLSDLSVRHHWMLGVTGSDKLNSRIPQHGSTHRCIMNGDESDPFFISHNFETSSELITFTDTNLKDGLVFVYRLRRIGTAVTRAEHHIFMKLHFLKELLLKRGLKKKYQGFAEGSWHNMNRYCKELVEEDKQPPAQILLEPAAVA